jgi:hypothetical protein
MYAMCTLKVPITIFIHFEKCGRQFLWADKEDKSQGKCLASWEMIYMPKDQGGLGVLDLRIQNKALLLKNLHQFYNRQDIPWVNLVWQAYYNNGQLPSNNANKGSFWWKDCPSLDHLYKENTTIDINNRKTCHLWTDNWLSSIRELDYPHLFSFAKNKNISCREAWTTCNDNAYDMFNLPLSTIAHEQFHELQDDIHIMNIGAGNDA